MSLENAKEFLREFQGNSEFRSSIENAADDETRRQLAQDAGYDFTKQEVKEVMSSDEKISDADLEAVAGGASSTGDVNPTVVVIAAAAAAAA